MSIPRDVLHAKILPDAFAADPDRLARFKREAQILASLNHPNIAAIYGIEETEGTRAHGPSRRAGLALALHDARAVHHRTDLEASPA